MSEETLVVDANSCPNCNNETLQFSGSGSDIRYKVCSRWKEPGHLTKDEILTKLKPLQRESERQCLRC